jgi:geranylgeranyl reductase family protein
MTRYDAIVVGGGPAGCSSSITLARRGLRVLLLEEKRMPREKLCGEFVTAECQPVLRRLDVAADLIDAGAVPINRIRLVASSGRSVEATISEISNSNADGAFGLSRGRFDQILFERARSAGVECLEGVAVKSTFKDATRATGVEAVSLPSGTQETFYAPFVIDASGRNSRLTLGKRERLAGRKGSRLYAMKVHMAGVEGIVDHVELYFFSRGYGGLSPVENGLSNLCFIVPENVLRRAGGDAARILRETICVNPEARDRLRTATAQGAWLTVGPLKFGKTRTDRAGVISVGDASGMIDPFTGTGIQMALRSGELAAQAVLETANSEDAGLRYRGLYVDELRRRFRTAGLLRRVVYSPTAADGAARLLGRFPGVARAVLKATRSTAG